MTDKERIADLEKQVEELTKLLHEALAKTQQVFVFPPLPAQVAPTSPYPYIQQPYITAPYKLPDIICNGQGYSTDGVTRLAPIV